MVVIHEVTKLVDCVRNRVLSLINDEQRPFANALQLRAECAGELCGIMLVHLQSSAQFDQHAVNRLGARAKRRLKDMRPGGGKVLYSSGFARACG
ncbi:hypothetical protein D3C71_1928040 [compost metagenome]